MSIYHVWFSTKYRREALTDEIGEFLLRFLREKAGESDVDILDAALEVDHVHLLLERKEGRNAAIRYASLQGSKCSCDLPALS
jgi:REP element-mobilizing transposase RayT